MADTKQLYVGIDAGSVSVNVIVINEQKEILHESPYKRHLGRVEEAVLEIIEGIFKTYSPSSIRAFAFTGNHSQTISRKLGGYYEFETISQVLGSLHLYPRARSIIAMGGQDTALFQINHEGETWELEYFNSNGPCASGTGSFIDQQAQRLATSIYHQKGDFTQGHIDRILEDFIELGLQSQRPSSVACRCTVFTKSDMIHLQNKGERLEDIIYGLHLGNARNYMSTMVGNRVLEQPVLFIGGLSKNELQVRAFKNYLPDLTVPAYTTSVGALGVALQALLSGLENSLDPDMLKTGQTLEAEKLLFAPKLELIQTVFPEDNDLTKKRLEKRTPVYLGLDVGSTTTKYALINEGREIIHKNYVPTQGKPIEVTQGLLRKIGGDLAGRIDIKGVATTGSGRNVVGDFLNADLIIDEITAHARGAVEIDPEIDTIFEIGGQDSKYISIANTFPLDFDMNKVCAAGTGSFLHELANKYGINIVTEFQEIALSSDHPVKLAERCTVFMESDLVFYDQKGVERKDLIAGLCYAIVHNYLNRVVGKRQIGQRIMFLGGPSLNKGVVAAFENVMGYGLIVPKHREVLGALGAAIALQEKLRLEKISASSFRGLDQAINDSMAFKERICRADPNCHNQCKLNIYDFDGRKSVWGGECGRYEVARSKGPKTENFFELRSRIWEKYLSGLYETLTGDPLLKAENRPTVGMQRSLYTLQTGVLWADFFDQLGYRLVLTPPTNSQLSDSGIESMIVETCYPVMVSHGHIKALTGKTSYLFLPVMINMSTPREEEAGFYCPLVQANRYMVQAALDLKMDNVLSPVLHLKNDPGTLALELGQALSKRLKVSQRKIKAALDHALERQRQFTLELYRQGEEILKNHDPRRPLVIVTGRPYNLYDERLNLRLGQNLSRIGVTALPMDFIDVSAVDISDFPDMYWGLGGQILRTARFVKEQPGYFGIHLTNFSCGADSFMEHFYKYLMDDKPYLILELDEHSAVAGVMTRLEAYQNVLENTMQGLRSAQAPQLRAAN